MGGITLSVPDLSHLVAIEEKWSEVERISTLLSYESFLQKAATANGLLPVPSPAVDKLWHAHLLHTELYQDYCLDRFGRVVHHVPMVEAHIVDELSRRLGRKIEAHGCGGSGPGITQSRAPVAAI